MSNNTLNDLNTHLFGQMDRLGKEGLEGDELDKEIKRAHSMTAVSQQIISNATLSLRAAELSKGDGLRPLKLPTMMAIGPDPTK